MNGTPRIRVLVAETSASHRALIVDVLEQSGQFRVVGTAVDGADAASQTERLQPDIVLMDSQMPKMDGIVATRAIMERCPTPIVMMTAGSSEEDVRVTFDAVKSGALAVIGKPSVPSSPSFEGLVARMLQSLRLMSEVKVVRRWPDRRDEGASSAPSTPQRAIRTRMVALAGSTGAPAVLADILATVGTRARSPLLIVQHMSEGFIEGFVGWLRQRTGVDVQLARDGIVAKSGCAYIARDGAHLGIRPDGRLCLVDSVDDDGFCPSGNALFRSLAASYGRAGMGVLLTGMGRDGASGLLDLRQAGGITVAQSEETCTVFGMPQEAIRTGAASYVLDPPEIAQLIVAGTVHGAHLYSAGASQDG